MKILIFLIIILSFSHAYASMNMACNEFENDPTNLRIGLHAVKVDESINKYELLNTCTQIAQKLEESKSAWPDVCDQYVEKINSKAYPSATWDQRRCFSKVNVNAFKSELSAFATGQSSKLHRDGQKYREIDIRHFLMATRPQCFHHNSLFGLYSCVEKNGRQLISKFKNLKKSWASIKGETPRLDQICKTLDENKMRKAELRFLATRTTGQKSYDGLPAYKECRQENISALLSSCENSGSRKIKKSEWECLKGSIHGLAEDMDGYDKYGPDHRGYHFLTRSLHLLKQNALKVSIFAKMCVNQLQDNAFRSTLNVDQMDEAGHFYCAEDEINKLIGKKVPKRNVNEIVPCEPLPTTGIDHLDLIFSAKKIEEKLLENGGELYTEEDSINMFELESRKYLQEKVDENNPAKDDIKKILSTSIFFDSLKKRKLKEYQSLQIDMNLSSSAAYQSILNSTKNEIDETYPENLEINIPKFKKEQVELEVPNKKLEKKQIDIAKRGLQGQPIDYMDFIIDADLSKLTHGEAEKKRADKLRALVKKARRAIGKAPYTLEQILKARDIVYEDTLRYYRGGYPGVLSFFADDPKGANCVARTKLLISIFQEDPNVKIQVFDNHLQAVWLSPNGQIIDLDSGVKSMSQIATIFDKKLMLTSYLHNSEIPTLSLDKLYYGGASNYSWGGNDKGYDFPINGIMSGAQVPEYLDQGENEYTQFKNLESDIFQSTNPEVLNLFDIYNVKKNRGKLCVRNSLNEYKDFQQPSISNVLGYDIMNENVFKDPEMSREYSQLETYTKRQEYLFIKLATDLNKLVYGLEVKNLISRIKNAKKYSDLIEEDFEFLMSILSYLSSLKLAAGCSFEKQIQLDFENHPVLNFLFVKNQELLKQRYLSEDGYKEVANFKSIDIFLAIDTHYKLVNYGNENATFEYMHDFNSYEKSMQDVVKAIDYTTNFNQVERIIDFLKYFENRAQKNLSPRTNREDHQDYLNILKKINDKQNQTSKLKEPDLDFLILTAASLSPIIKDKIVNEEDKKLYLEAFARMVQRFKRSVEFLKLADNIHVDARQSYFDQFVGEKLQRQIYLYCSSNRAKVLNEKNIDESLLEPNISDVKDIKKLEECKQYLDNELQSMSVQKELTPLYFKK